MDNRSGYKSGRLSVKNNRFNNSKSEHVGVHMIGLDDHRDGYIYVPASYRHDQPAAFALLLHGAGCNPDHGLSILRHYADNHNIGLLAPASRKYSWDIIADDEFNRDVLFIDQALAIVFQRFNIDSKKPAIGGFSDGASYAGCLGLSNGDLFTHVLAF